MPERHRHRGLRPGVLAAVLVLTLVAAVPAHATPAGRPGPAATAGGNGACPGTVVGATFAGALSVDGGPLAPSAAAGANVTVAFDEQVTVRYVPNGTLVSVRCEKATTSAVTNASGGFNGSVVLPADTCVPVFPSGEECSSYAGPFPPFAATTNATPSGYGLRSSANNSTFRLAWVAGLASLGLSPSGSVDAIAPGGAFAFRAAPLAANGSSSPFAVNFTWNLAGAGFAFAPPPSGGNATVTATARASNGTLSVRASATIGSAAFTTPTVKVDLVSVATVVRNGTVDRSVADVGQAVSADVTAVGASGYLYRATVVPGLGAPNATVDCSTAPASPTEVTVACAASIVYPTPGTARPSLRVSNGDASATWTSGAITVVPALAVRVAPAAPIGYVGASLPVAIVAANGSGAAPYEEACLAPGDGSPSCDAGAGPVWNFAPVYSAPGRYPALAWAVDAAGWNRSLNVSVEVVDPPTLGNVSASTVSPAAGEPFNVSAVLSGGALPAAFWWNASDLNRSIASGSVAEDGTLLVPFVPPHLGTVEVTLTVRDALGTVRSSALRVVVGPGPVALLRAELSPEAAADLVGQPVPLLWQAFDALGEAVPTFSAAVDLVIRSTSGASAPSWVNTSEFGALAPSPEGSFAIPATFWSDGGLRLNLTPAVAGPLTVELEGTSLPGGSVPLALVALPDVTHLRLYDPVVAVAGAATNRTYWHVSDRYGDPVPGALLTLEYVGPATVSEEVLVAGWAGPTSTGVWVNYSVPTTPGGVVRLLDAAGDVLVGPVVLGPPPALSTPTPSAPLGVLIVPAALATGAAVAAIVAVARRRPVLPLPPSEEEELRRLAEGRAEVVELVERAGAAELATIAAAWGERGPPSDLPEWVASLVADGTLAEGTGPGGGVVYTVAPPRIETPRVTVDPRALERAVAAREASVREEADPGP